MKFKGQVNEINELIEYAKDRKGSYAEYQYTKKLHKELSIIADGWKKNNKVYEYWVDIDDENTLWRIILKQ